MKCGKLLRYPNQAKDNNERYRRWYALNRLDQIEKAKKRQLLHREHINYLARTRYHGRYRDSKIAKIYGISKEEARKWLSISSCEICGSSDRRMVIDHQHGTTGKVRGRLCTQCNSGLGHFKDNPDTMIKAAQYLRDRLEKEA